MWISIFSFAIAVAIFLSVATVMINVKSAKVKSISSKSPNLLNRRIKSQEANMGKLTPANDRYDRTGHCRITSKS